MGLLQRLLRCYGFWLFCLTAAAPLSADVRVEKDMIVPNRIRAGIELISADWVQKIPPSGSVNVPEFLSSLYPGQKFALVVMAEGPDRDKLLHEATIQVSFDSKKNGLANLRDLKPVTIRPIKAEGADMVLLLLKAAEIGQKDTAAVEKGTSLVSLAVFESDWTVPNVQEVENVRITGVISSGKGEIPIASSDLPIRPASDWLKEKAPSMEELGKDMNRCHDAMSPGRLLARLVVCAQNGALKTDSVFSYFAIAFRENAAARDAAVASFPSLDSNTQTALLYVLRRAGQDVGMLLPTVSHEMLGLLQPLDPLADPRKISLFRDPVKPEEVGRVGTIMDQCWAGWMATGDASYLKPLVGLLEGAADYPAFEAWAKARGGAKGLNASVGRGLAYQIAGWSVSSFQRTDPRVSDWLLYWEKDSTIPASVRKEIGNLAGNPAFRRK